MLRHDSRHHFQPVGAALALCAMVPLLSVPTEAASPVSSGEGSLYTAPSKSVKVVQASADLSLDLDRLGKRGAGGEVFDLFPPAAGSSSQSKGKAGGKRSAPAQPAKGEADEMVVNPGDAVVSVVPPLELSLPAQESPAAAPVLIAPLPPPPSVAPPVIAAPPPPPPPAPKPPAVPFVYIGKFEEGARTVYFLVKGDKLFMVKAGEDIDEAYSFDGEADNLLRLTYKPLRVAQTLTVGP